MSALSQTAALTFSSSIGRKILVALTGAVLVLFVLGHMIGNLLVFVGPDALNSYGQMLHDMGHGMLIWIVRAFLLLCVVVHIVVTLQLTKENRAARQDCYGYPKTIQAQPSSLIMIFTGLVVLGFIVYHLMHFTFHVGNNYGTYMTSVHGETVHDVYRMVITGFTWWPASAFYIFAMGVLCSHLSHGVSSMFQTLGLATARTWPLFRAFGTGYGWLIFLGNSLIPVAVLMHWLPLQK